jgi:hypothetical protein
MASQAEQAAAPQSLRTRDGELILLIAEQTHRVSFVRYLSSGILGLLLVQYVPVQWVALWLGSLWLILWLRTVLLRRMPGDDARSDGQKLRQIAWLFLATTAGQAASMAFAPWLPTAVMTVITVYLVGTLTANLHATAGYLPVVVPMSLATHAPMRMGTFAGRAAVLLGRALRAARIDHPRSRARDPQRVHPVVCHPAAAARIDPTTAPER